MKLWAKKCPCGLFHTLLGSGWFSSAHSVLVQFKSSVKLLNIPVILRITALAGTLIYGIWCRLQVWHPNWTDGFLLAAGQTGRDVCAAGVGLKRRAEEWCEISYYTKTRLCLPCYLIGRDLFDAGIECHESSWEKMHFNEELMNANIQSSWLV